MRFVMLWVFQGFPDKEQPLSGIWGGEGNFSGKEIPLRLMTEEGRADVPSSPSFANVAEPPVPHRKESAWIAGLLP